eukprot:6213596-Pleurochrysis_carterae.AAC.5
MPDACQNPAGALTRRRACCHCRRGASRVCAVAFRLEARRCPASTNLLVPSLAGYSSQQRRRRRGKRVPPAG